jgi:DNA mismatch repair ATPase MutS
MFIALFKYSRTRAMLRFIRTNRKKVFRSLVCRISGSQFIKGSYKLALWVGVLNFTKTTLGKALLRQWCLRPSLSREVISARHDAVACFLRGENMMLAETMHVQLKGLRDVPRSLSIIRAGKAGTREWQAMVKGSHLIPHSRVRLSNPLCIL